MLQPWMIPSDLAPGDAKSVDRDWSGVELRQITSTEDRDFDTAFGALWAEFGASAEIEQPEVLARRMTWDGSVMTDGCALRYRMLMLVSGGKLAAVRDHTAIVQEGTEGAVVHLSHNLVAPEWRRTGLAGWMRALPIQTARSALAVQNRALSSPITLVGEMEHPDPDNLASGVRLKAYEKAGHRIIDPSVINYLQPDFRSPADIDASHGPCPIPMGLVIRRVGREMEATISGAEVFTIVSALYRMYASGFRPTDMRPLFAALESYPNPDARIPLLPPTAGIRPHA